MRHVTASVLGAVILHVAPLQNVPATDPIPTVVSMDAPDILQPGIPGSATTFLWATNTATYSDSVVWRASAVPSYAEVSFLDGTRWQLAPGEVRRQAVKISLDSSAVPNMFDVTVTAGD